MIIAVDFDGTLCENKYPEIGQPITYTIYSLKKLREQGNKLILWTCRENEMLENALKWCKEQGLEFDTVNDSLEEEKLKYGTSPRKIGADVYIDDKNADIHQIHMMNLAINGFYE